MAETSKRNIIDLNTYCLIEIFRYLDYKDWINLKLAHDIFGEACNHMVRVNGNDIKFELNSEKKSDYFVQMDILERFLELFGNETRALNIKFSGSRRDNRSIDALLEKYCMAGNIKHCNLNGLELRRPFFSKNMTFLNSLVSLKLHNSTNVLDAHLLLDFIATSRNLKEFYFSSTKCKLGNRYDFFRKIASSNLEICHINLPMNRDLTREISSLPINYTLKELSSERSTYDPAILLYFPKIESLKLSFFEEFKYSMNPILLLSELKSLDLNCLFCVKTTIPLFLPKLANQNNLESFTLRKFLRNSLTDMVEESEIANALCKMTNLKKLNLRTSYSFQQHLPTIGNSLKNLEEFSYLCPPGCLDGYSIDFLLDFIKVSKNLKIIRSASLVKFGSDQLFESLANIRKAQQATEILHIEGLCSTKNVTLSDEQKKYIKFI